MSKKGRAAWSAAHAPKAPRVPTFAEMEAAAFARLREAHTLSERDSQAAKDVVEVERINRLDGRDRAKDVEELRGEVARVRRIYGKHESAAVERWMALPDPGSFFAVAAGVCRQEVPHHAKPESAAALAELFFGMTLLSAYWGVTWDELREVPS